jgi:hypothetical protein
LRRTRRRSNPPDELRPCASSTSSAGRSASVGDRAIAARPAVRGRSTHTIACSESAGDAHEEAVQLSLPREAAARDEEPRKLRYARASRPFEGRHVEPVRAQNDSRVVRGSSERSRSETSRGDRSRSDGTRGRPSSSRRERDRRLLARCARRGGRGAEDDRGLRRVGGGVPSRVCGTALVSGQVRADRQRDGQRHRDHRNGRPPGGGRSGLSLRCRFDPPNGLCCLSLTCERDLSELWADENELRAERLSVF